MGDRYQAVLLFGAPGAGKGTQGKLLGNLPGYFHLSTGDMFRAMDGESELGRLFHEYSSAGELVPDEITVDVWRRYVNALTTLNKYRPHRQLMVLDGLPRTVNQVGLIRDHVDVALVVHLTADRKKMIERLRGRAMKEQRPDDAREEVVRNRLDIYERETRPVLDCFDPAVVRDIDAIGSPGAVLAKILGAVTPVQEARFPNALQA